MSKAMVAYEKALEWQELFDLALREHMSEVDIISMGYRIAGWFLKTIYVTSTIEQSSLPEDLSSKKRYPEAARVLLDYSKDTRQAVITFVQGHDFSEARRVVRTTVRHAYSAHYFVSLDGSTFITRARHRDHPSGSS